MTEEEKQKLIKKIADDFDGVSIFYLCNPNNPTGTVTAADDLFAWIESFGGRNFFLLDEAYFEFVTDASCRSAMTLVKQGAKNIAVTRTFSKLYALPAYRVGYAIADSEVIALSEGLLPCVNINMAGGAAALASLEDDGFVADVLENLQRSRDIVEAALRALSLKFIPSNANFIFHEINGDAKSYAQRMKASGIWVGRAFPPIEGWNRVTLGRPEEMETFVATLKIFRENGWV